MTATTAPRMMLPSFAFDLRETTYWSERFDDEKIAEHVSSAMDYRDFELDTESAAIWLAPIVGDDADDLAALVTHDDGFDDPDRQEELEARYNIDEIQFAFRDAEQYAYERAMLPDAKSVELRLGDAIEACKGEEMYGILTDAYWCGVLAAYPWSEITLDEDAVVSAVLDKARVKGSTFTLSYRSTPYNAALRRVARQEDGDPGFGGNSEMEMGTIARYVCKATVVLLQRDVDDRLERGIDIDRNELAILLAEACKENQS